eukprot:g9672.t1
MTKTIGESITLEFFRCLDSDRVLSLQAIEKVKGNSAADEDDEDEEDAPDVWDEDEGGGEEDEDGDYDEKGGRIRGGHRQSRSEFYGPTVHGSASRREIVSAIPAAGDCTRAGWKLLRISYSEQPECQSRILCASINELKHASCFLWDLLPNFVIRAGLVFQPQTIYISAAPGNFRTAKTPEHIYIMKAFKSPLLAGISESSIEKKAVERINDIKITSLRDVINAFEHPMARTVHLTQAEKQAKAKKEGTRDQKQTKQGDGAVSKSSKQVVKMFHEITTREGRKVVMDAEQVKQVMHDMKNHLSISEEKMQYLGPGVDVKPTVFGAGAGITGVGESSGTTFLGSLGRTSARSGSPEKVGSSTPSKAEAQAKGSAAERTAPMEVAEADRQHNRAKIEERAAGAGKEKDASSTKGSGSRSGNGANSDQKGSKSKERSKQNSERTATAEADATGRAVAWSKSNEKGKGKNGNGKGKAAEPDDAKKDADAKVDASGRGGKVGKGGRAIEDDSKTDGGKNKKEEAGTAGAASDAKGKGKKSVEADDKKRKGGAGKGADRGPPSETTAGAAGKDKDNKGKGKDKVRETSNKGSRSSEMEIKGNRQQGKDKGKGEGKGSAKQSEVPPPPPSWSPEEEGALAPKNAADSKRTPPAGAAGETGEASKKGSGSDKGQRDGKGKGKGSLSDHTSSGGRGKGGSPPQSHTGGKEKATANASSSWVDVVKTRCMKLFFEIQTFTAFFAVFNSFIILVSASGYPGKFFLFALLNCFMFPPAALFVFYQGYRGLAINSSSLLTQFKVANAIALLLTLLCCFVPMGAINGFGRYDTDLYTHSSGKGYWGFAIFVESMMYLANLGLASFTMFKVVSFDPHGTSGGGGQGAGMEMARV